MSVVSLELLLLVREKKPLVSIHSLQQEGFTLHCVEYEKERRGKFIMTQVSYQIFYQSYDES